MVVVVAKSLGEEEEPVALGVVVGTIGGSPWGTVFNSSTSDGTLALFEEKAFVTPAVEATPLGSSPGL